MKCGLKTFPLSVDLDDSVKLIEAEYGVQGFAIVIKLYQAIYSRGYYMKWDTDAKLLFIRDYCLTEVGRDLVSEVVECCIRREVFEPSLYKEHNILTSKRIQETFLTATKRSTKVVFDKQYALPIVYEFIQNVSKSGKNVNIFFKNDDILQQRKGKEKKEEENPPNPQEGGGETQSEWRDKFFDKFNQFAKKNYHDEGVDYKTLYLEFCQSVHLQNMYSFPQVVRIYPKIKNGYYRDKKSEQEQRIDAINAKADRERYYANLQARAQARVDRITEIAMGDSRFKELSKELSKLEIELARAEVYNLGTLDDLKQKQEQLLSERASVLRKLGIKESDFTPTFKCEKCSDTGYLPSGVACDCYNP